jgi:hypothetical protein
LDYLSQPLTVTLHPRPLPLKKRSTKRVTFADTTTTYMIPSYDRVPVLKDVIRANLGL